MDTNQYPHAGLLQDRVKESVSFATVSQRFGAGTIDLIIAFSLAYLIPVFGSLLSVAYYLSKDAFPFFNGQSLGKKLFQIRVVSSQENQPITGEYAVSMLRSVTVLMPLANLVEVVVVFLGTDRFGDRWAGTTVVKDLS